MSWFDRTLKRALFKPAMRGRVHKVSVVKGGEVSVVVRFGVEEPTARQLNQGALLEIDVVPHTAGKAAGAILASERKPSGGKVNLKGAMPGEPTRELVVPKTAAPERLSPSDEETARAGSWPQSTLDSIERQRKYEAAFEEIYGKHPNNLTDAERTTPEVFEASVKAEAKINGPKGEA